MIGMCVAIDGDGAFGSNGKIPWNIPADFKHFTSTVKNGICIVGKQTIIDMANMMGSTKRPGKLLPKCLLNTTPMVVVSSDTQYTMSDELRELANKIDQPLYLTNSVDAAVKLCKMLYSDRNIWFIGGERIFSEGLKYCDCVLTTILPACFIECDRYFDTKTLMAEYYPEFENDIVDPVYANVKIIKWSRLSAN